MVKQHQHTAPTPTSTRREKLGQSQKKAQRPAEPRRPALARPPTPEELAKVVQLSRAGRVLHIPPYPPLGLVCACDGVGRCLAHAKTAGQERVKVKALPSLPPAS